MESTLLFTLSCQRDRHTSCMAAALAGNAAVRHLLVVAYTDSAWRAALAQPTTCARARNAASMESKTLRSHRVIGEVADGTPQTCAFYDLGGVGYCAVRVGGDAFQVMALDGLTVQSASPRLGRNIRAIGAQGEWTYCAIDDEVWCFLRARFVGLAAGAPAAVDRFELCANQPVRRAHPAILP